MLLFRSEEHLERWLDQRDRTHGATMSLAQQRELGTRWYENRLAEDWKKRSPEEAQAILEKVGLSGPFWQLA
jgi:hypothetical protein